MSYIEKEKLIKADIASIENRVRHAFNQGYDLGYKDGKEKAKASEQEPFINKPCVSSEVCEHDKNKVLDKLRAEIDGLPCYFAIHIDKEKVLAIIDKYRAEIESQESEV